MEHDLPRVCNVRIWGTARTSYVESDSRDSRSSGTNREPRHMEKSKDKKVTKKGSLRAEKGVFQGWWCFQLFGTALSLSAFGAGGAHLQCLHDANQNVSSPSCQRTLLGFFFLILLLNSFFVNITKFPSFSSPQCPPFRYVSPTCHLESAPSLRRPGVLIFPYDFWWESVRCVACYVLRAATKPCWLGTSNDSGL